MPDQAHPDRASRIPLSNSRSQLDQEVIQKLNHEAFAASRRLEEPFMNGGSSTRGSTVLSNERKFSWESPAEQTMPTEARVSTATEPAMKTEVSAKPKLGIQTQNLRIRAQSILTRERSVKREIHLMREESLPRRASTKASRSLEQTPTPSRRGITDSVGQHWSLGHWITEALPSFLAQGKSFNDVLRYFDRLEHERCYGPTNPVEREWLVLTLKLMRFPGIPADA
ncbi:hypothetical protein MMC13_001142 [Lambiella insularis]|nr:hypothetical protein [Lambiella insularis]